MSETPVRLSPLARVRDTAVAGIGERAHLGHLNLRGDARDARFVEAVRGATGMEPPRAPNTLARAGELLLAWLGPDEWLLLTPPGAAPALQKALEGALAGLHAGVVEISDGNTVIGLEGTDAAEILACECPLDFHPRVFPVGSCAQSVIGKSNVLILREDAQRFAVVVRRSFAEYLHALLCHLAAEVRATQG
jgi:sarcosine oxidase subunit gamma